MRSCSDSDSDSDSLGALESERLARIAANNILLGQVGVRSALQECKKEFLETAVVPKPARQKKQSKESGLPPLPPRRSARIKTTTQRTYMDPADDDEQVGLI
jgi:hypothetical protein